MKFNKKFVIILITVVAAAWFAYVNLKPKSVEYKTEIVARGTIVEDISETGTVKKGEEVNLNFKSAGTVANVGVVVGQSVVAGEVLAGLDARQLGIQLEQAKASLELSRSQLQKLLNGADGEDVAIGQTGVQNANSALESAKSGLADAQINAAQKLAGAYKDAADALSSAYAKAYNAQTYSALVQRSYFTPQDEDWIGVWETTQKIATAPEKIKTSLELARSSNANGDFDNALLIALDQLTIIDNGLQNIRSVCEKKPWRDIVPEADKSGLDLQRDYIVAAYASINSNRQNIILQKTANEVALNTAQAAVTAASGALKTAQDQLRKISAGPRQEDVDSLNAQIDQANAQVSLLELQIADSQLKTSVGGAVIKVNVEAGETVPQAGTPGAIVVLPDNPYEVDVDIYEEDVAKEKTGDKVMITPVSLPDKSYEGTVVLIDPVGKIINGVVYYTTKIGFDNVPEGLKPEMTADVVISTAKSENAILVSEGAVQKNDKGYYVQILKNGKPENVPVQVGIRSKGEVEIIAGLIGGEEVIIP